MDCVDNGFSVFRGCVGDDADWLMRARDSSHGTISGKENRMGVSQGKSVDSRLETGCLFLESVSLLACLAHPREAK